MNMHPECGDSSATLRLRARLPFAILAASVFGLVAILFVLVGGVAPRRALAQESYSFIVEFAGDGTGVVAEEQRHFIECNNTCALEFPAGFVLNLLAAPTGLSEFAGWSGDCSGMTCSVSLTEPKHVIATFNALPSKALTVTINGTGNGSVESDPSGLLCTESCSAIASEGMTLTLTATPAEGSAFTGWGGDCSGTDAACALTMSADREAIATFDGIPPATYQLTVNRGGTGAGKVTSAPGGIDCGATCSAAMTNGASVTLTAAPEPGHLFAGWTGACSGVTTTCVVQMKQAQSVSAYFFAQTSSGFHQVTAVIGGAGAGVVASQPAGMVCTTGCDLQIVAGSTITLVAASLEGSVFDHWLGDCTGGEPVCVLTLTDDVAVAAIMELAPLGSITLGVAREGFGRVTSLPAGINCGWYCNGVYAESTQITLTALPDTGHEFVGWGEDCSGVEPTCTLTLTSHATAFAHFSPRESAFVAVVKAGSGSGSVASTPTGLDCGDTCEKRFYLDDEVTLTASPATGSTFSGWSGDCTGSNSTCTFTMTGLMQITATFALDGGSTVEVTVTQPEATKGSIEVEVVTETTATLLPASGDATEASYPVGTTLKLTAVPNTGYEFAGWTGDLTGTLNPATVTVNGALSIGATFTEKDPTGSLPTVWLPHVDR